MNELVSISDGTTFAYDAVGNMTTKYDGTNTWLYTYDTKNQLTEVEKNQQIVAQYEYDGDGKRIKKTEWIESLQEHHTTIYAYSGLNVIYEKNLDTDKEAIYIYGATGRIAKKVDGLTDYYHTDHLGSTRLITNESGNTVTDVSYMPFGEDVITGDNDSYLFTGKQKDASGLYYYGARYYDPEIGRFLTRDTLYGEIKAPQTLNRYVYCLNNPLKYIDPTGNESDDPQKAVEDIFERLKNISPEISAEIQEKVDSGELSDIQALEQIIELLGFSVLWTNSDKKILAVKISDDLTITVRTAEDLKDEKGNPLWGRYKSKTKTAFIDFSKSKNVGDMALIFLHEASHAVLDEFGIGVIKQEQIIYSVQFSYMMASRFTSVFAQYSGDYMRHVGAQSFNRDPSGIFRPSIPDILKRWLPKTGHPVA